jgi:hypothetical protein
VVSVPNAGNRALREDRCLNLWAKACAVLTFRNYGIDVPSPVPKHLRTDAEHRLVPRRLRDHVCDLDVMRPEGYVVFNHGPRHAARFAPGLPTTLIGIAGTEDVGDPMAGTGTLAHETGLPLHLNDLDDRMAYYFEPLRDRCTLSHKPADQLDWQVGALVFSPPYYPKTDRTRACAHNDAKRGPVVGFRDSYDCDHPQFIGNPGGVNAIRTYREQMTTVYGHLAALAPRMIVVTKNWTRLGTEMRLDLDTILMAMETGKWKPVARHGWQPPPSLWARYNHKRGGMILVEDVLVFEGV